MRGVTTEEPLVSALKCCKVLREEKDVPVPAACETRWTSHYRTLEYVQLHEVRLIADGKLCVADAASVGQAVSLLKPTALATRFLGVWTCMVLDGHTPSGKRCGKRI